MACWVCSVALQAVGLVKPPAPVATRAPTVTVASAADDVEPTATKVEADNAQELREYTEWAVARGLKAGELVQTIGQQITKASRDITLIRNRDWVITTAAALAELDIVGEEIQDRRNVPPDAQAVHRHMLDMASQMKIVRDDLATGIDDLNAQKIQSAGAAIARMGEIAREMRSDLAELKATAGIDD